MVTALGEVDIIQTHYARKFLERLLGRTVEVAHFGYGDIRFGSTFVTFFGENRAIGFRVKDLEPTIYISTQDSKITYDNNLLRIDTGGGDVLEISFFEEFYPLMLQSQYESTTSLHI